MIVMCSTEGCMNKDIEIEIEEVTDIVICGPCGADLYEREP